uniref:Uncharacterized protein n=1 Tax=Anguilla anguilla TaxID=7936 RepID=A0A0E9XFE7_ANGAN
MGQVGVWLSSLPLTAKVLRRSAFWEISYQLSMTLKREKIKSKKKRETVHWNGGISFQTVKLGVEVMLMNVIFCLMN